ncbi:MAG: pdhC, partial [Deltaproteobacteria bacterium]|nr:pdhC [Deltaproteobacteria bacterium]
MAVDVIMPSLGFDMTEGTLARWLVQEGERIEKGQAIAEIETEKATVEIEATLSGVLAKIVVAGGRTVPVGTVIGTIAAPEEKPPEKTPPAVQPVAAPPATPPRAPEPPAAVPPPSDEGR